MAVERLELEVGTDVLLLETGDTLLLESSSIVADIDQPEVIPGGRFFGTKTVTTAGTAEALASLGARVRAMSVVAKGGNTGQVYLGGSDVASTTNSGLDSGEFVEVKPGGWFDLADLYIDVDTDGEGVDLWGIDD